MNSVKQILPRRLTAFNTMLGRSYKFDQALKRRFVQVYKENLWGDSESVSGPGSRRDSGSVLASLQALEMIKAEIGFRSLNDIPCGDFNWIHKFLLANPGVQYKGFDIVPMLIRNNKRVYSSRFKFKVLDITSSVPPYADLIFSKDFFNHLSFADVGKAIRNMKASKAQYLLCSNNMVDSHLENEEIFDNSMGHSRLLDLCLAPFNLPRPIWNTHYLALWRFSDLDV